MRLTVEHDRSTGSCRPCRAVTDAFHDVPPAQWKRMQGAGWTEDHLHWVAELAIDAGFEGDVPGEVSAWLNAVASGDYGFEPYAAPDGLRGALAWCIACMTTRRSDERPWGSREIRRWSGAGKYAAMAYATETVTLGEARRLGQTGGFSQPELLTLMALSNPLGARWFTRLLG